MVPRLQVTVFLDKVSQRDVYRELVWVRVFPTGRQLLDCLAADLVVLVWVQALVLGTRIVIDGVVGGSSVGLA